MAAAQTPSTSQSTNGAAATGEPAGVSFCKYSASERPNTRGERIAFQLWIIMFLLMIMFTLINYLVTRLF